MTFERFLSAEYARDYVFQDEPYEEQIARAVKYIRDAYYVLLGVGAGMSTAAGAGYGGKLFSTNADHQFEKAGDPAERIFATQGNYNRIQRRKCCHSKTYCAVDRFRPMDAARANGRIPSAMVPKCPVCGGPMAMNLRSDSHFVQDENWYAAEDCTRKYRLTGPTRKRTTSVPSRQGMTILCGAFCMRDPNMKLTFSLDHGHTKWEAFTVR